MQKFHVDKSLNVVVEALLEDFVRLYWIRQGKQVHVYENVYEDLKGQKGYDRRDSLGNLWEFKGDKAAWGTPNVCIERTVDQSKANMFMRLVEGQVWVTTRENLQALLTQNSAITAVGDGKRALSTLIRKQAFYEVSVLVEPPDRDEKWLYQLFL